MFRKENFVKPWVIVLVSVSTSAVLYSILVVLLDLKEPLIGLAISTGAPFVISLPIALVISKYIKHIQQQKEELVELDDINKRLFSLLSHDLRSPLASQRQTLDLCLSKDLDLESGKEILGQLSQQTDDLIQFLNDILEWASQQRSGEEIEKRLFSAQEVIVPVLNIYEKLAKDKGLSLKLGNINSSVYADTATL